MTHGERLSATDVLPRLDGVFTLDELLAVTDWDRHYARNAVQRYRASGLVEYAGPRAAVYFNRLRLGLERDRDRPGSGIDARARAVAACKAYPGAVLVGEIPCNVAMWTDAPSSGLARVAFRRTRDVNPRAKLDGVVHAPRPAWWWREIAPGAVRTFDGGDLGVSAPEWVGAPALPPHLALADALVYGAGDEVAPDAVDLSQDRWDRGTEDVLDLVRSALDRMRAPEEAYGLFDEMAAAQPMSLSP